MVDGTENALEPEPPPNRERSRWFRHWNGPTTTAIVSLIAFVSSQASCFLSARTYMLTQRSYVGVVDATGHMHPEAPCESPKLEWKVTFKNQSPTPVQMQLQSHRLYVREGDQDYVDIDPAPGHVVNMMPDAENHIRGTFACDDFKPEVVANCKAILCRVWHKTAEAEIGVRFTYWGPGWLWGRRAYSYRTRIRYQPPPHEGLFQIDTVAD